ncbi:MAG: TIGR03435 family protein, partial [Terriglobia bacterium]
LLLAVAGFLAIAVPIGFGLARPNAELGSAPAAQSARASETTGTLSAPEFEVASIRPAKPVTPGAQVMLHPGGFTATNVTAKMLVAFAYNSDQTGMWLSSDQLSSGPKWISSERFDIEAKVPDSLVHNVEMKVPADQWIDQIRLMVQSMLAKRFKLKVSYETKEIRVYALVAAKHGPKLTESKLPPLGPGRPRSHRRGLDMTGRGNLSASWATIGLLAGLLSRQPEVGGRVVLDQTGLKGHYDFTLKWTPETESGQFPSGPGRGGVAGGSESAIAGVGGGQSVAGIRAVPDSSGPSLFSALREQLGLKLKPERAPVQVLVIDHIEQPTPN